MTQNIEERTELAVKKYESASGVVEKIANTDGYVETGSGHKKSFPKISREWDENSQKMQKDWGDESQRLQTEFQNESAVIREDWQIERDSLSIKALGVKLWQSGASESNINQQRRWTDNHTYLPKSVPAAMNASGPDESWIPYTADKSSTLEDVFGRTPTDLIVGITLTPNSKQQYPKLLAMGGTWEMEDGLKAFVVDNFVITSGDILRITDTDGAYHDAVRLSGASREWTTQRFPSVIVNVDQLKNVEGVKEGQQIELLGYHAEGDGGGGSLIWMLSAPHAANDATVFAVGNGFWVRRNLTISPRQAGWLPDKQGPVRIRELLNLGVKFNKPSRLTSLQGQAARWAAGLKAPVCFFGDSTTDGRVTTLDGENLATAWNINRLINGDVPDDLVYDHDDTEVPNAYPNVLQRILREFHANNLVRVYNAGYRGKQAQDGWAVDNVHNAVYGNATYQDAEWIGIMFGLNDSYASSNPEQLERRTYVENQSLVLDAFARGVQPALMSCPPSNNTADSGDYGNNNEVNELVDQVKRRLAHEYGIEFLDVNQAVKHWIYNNGDKVCFAGASPDGLHLNDLGHLKKAEFIFKTAERDNVPTLTEDRHCFDVVHSSVRYALSRNDISSSDPIRGANKLYQNGVIESHDIDKVLGKNVIDLWVWNERRDHSLIYRAYKDARMSFHLANREDLPRFVIEAQLFTANDYHKETIFDDISPECIGKTGGGRSDFPCFLGKLRYGLNRIRLVMPATAKNLFDSGAITGYLTVGWLDFIADRQENRLPVMHHNYGFSYMDKAHWRDVVAGRGRVIHPPVDTGTPKNYVRNIVSPSLHGFNTYSMKKPGDTVEFRFLANFPSGTGVVLSWNKMDDSGGYPPEYDKDILFSSGGVFFFYVNTSPTPYVRFAFLSPANGGAPPLLETGVDISEVQDKTLLIKMQLLQDYTIKVTMLRADLSQLYEGLITDPAVVGEIATGYCGGSFSNGSSASGAFELEYLQLREYQESV